MGIYKFQKFITKWQETMLKKVLKGFGIALLVLVGIIAALVIFIVISPNGKITLPLKHKPIYTHENMASFPQPLKVEGNRLVNAEGETVFLNGLMPQEPSKLHSRNRFGRKLFDKIATTGANVMRIPVDPQYFINDEFYTERYLDKIVSWAGENGMYVIIDLHYIGNIATGAGKEMPDMEQNPLDLSLEFWMQTAAYFKDVPHVIFEIYNEPASIDVETWRASAQKLIDAIRAQGAKQLIIAGGVEYSRDLSWVLDQPLEDANLAYAAHIYPAHAQSMWDYWFGKTAEKYPVLLTEWGFMEPDGDSAHNYLVGTVDNYGAPLLSYADENLAGWVTCWYDDSWFPQMFYKGMKATTPLGAFVLEKLAK